MMNGDELTQEAELEVDGLRKLQFTTASWLEQETLESDRRWGDLWQTGAVGQDRANKGKNERCAA